jgi:hypothetical protein
MIGEDARDVSILANAEEDDVKVRRRFDDGCICRGTFVWSQLGGNRSDYCASAEISVEQSVVALWLPRSDAALIDKKKLDTVKVAPARGQMPKDEVCCIAAAKCDPAGVTRAQRLGDGSGNETRT